MFFNIKIRVYARLHHDNWDEVSLKIMNRNGNIEIQNIEIRWKKGVETGNLLLYYFNDCSAFYIVKIIFESGIYLFSFSSLHSLRNMFTFFLKIYISKLSWQYICFKNFETYISYHILFKDGEKRKQYLLFCNPFVKEVLLMIAAKAISGGKKYLFPKS